MKQQFAYSVLRYAHSKFLGEQLNVGVLFVFPENGIVAFHAPKKIGRLINAYPGTSEKLIKNYLTGFEKKVKTLSKSLDHYAFDFNELVREHLITEDASSLQFDTFKHAISYGTVEETKNLYLDLLLSPYESEIHPATPKLSDKDIVSSCRKLIISKRPEIQDYLKADERRILRNKRVTFKSDFYWQNGTTNFVKGVSFDLAKEENIIDKSVLIYGQLRQLELKQNKSNSRIDLLFHQPSNPDFLAAYEEAKTIIDQVQLNSTIIENLDAYSKKVVSEIEAPEA